MKTYKETWGSWTDHSLSWEQIKIIELSFNSVSSSKDVVRKAIQIAKRYRCKIIEPAEYKNRKITFWVECSRWTPKDFYENGIGNKYDDDTITEKDFEEYKKKFDTDKCKDTTFTKIFWYCDNWSGNIHKFKNLKAAKEAANKETGRTIYIWQNFPFGLPNKIAAKVKASGTMLP